MTAKEYSKCYDLSLNFKKVAESAFNEGLKQGLKQGRNEGKSTDVKELEKKLKETKAELKNLWDTLNDSESCGEFLAGM